MNYQIKIYLGNKIGTKGNNILSRTLEKPNNEKK